MSSATSSPHDVSVKQIAIEDQRFQYFEAGSGDTLILLLHGWPQDASEWQKIVPLLADRFHVIAVDLPGIGGSTSQSRDFSKARIAQEMSRFVKTFEARNLVIVGHDIGGMIAYAYARLFASEVTGAIILDVPLPGLGAWKEIETLPESWHFRFHAQTPLAEQLVAGRQAQYFRYFIDAMAMDTKAITDAEVDGYAAAYAAPDQLSAGFGFYRTFPQDEQFNAEHDGPLAVPLLIAGGSASLGEGTTLLAHALQGHGVQDARSAVIMTSGHWVAEEQPAQTAALIEAFAEEVMQRIKN